MLTLSQIFLKNTLVLLIVAFIILLGGSYLTIREFELDNSRQTLENLCETISPAIATAPDYQLFSVDLSKKLSKRITLIDSEGRVLADSHENPEKMENHRLRPEIMASNTHPYGSSVRLSHTLNREFLYVSKRVTLSDRVVYLRCAADLSSIIDKIYTLWGKIGLLFFLAVIAALLMNWRLSRQLSQEVEEITIFLGEIEKKNFTQSISPQLSSEFFQIARSLIKLSRRLAKKEKTKAKYVAKLKLKNRQITDVIEAISHEFKNPVAAIMGYVETIKNDPDIDKKILKRFLEKIHDNGRTISELIDRLTLSLKLENDTVKLSKTTFSLAELARNCADNLEQKYHNRHVNLICQTPSHVLADKAMIALVISNLIDNALKYSKDDVTLECLYQDSLGVTLHVRDKGVGIAESEIKNITKKFYRVDRYSWDNSLGIGLSLVDYILSLHESRLEIASQLGEGADFSFVLPFHPVALQS